MSTYRGCLDAATFGFGFYQWTASGPEAHPVAPIYWPREGGVTSKAVASGHGARSPPARLLRSAGRSLADLSGARVAKRPGHLQHVRRDLDPGDHRLPRCRTGPAVGRDQIPPVETARGIHPAADPRQPHPRDRLD